MKKLLLLLLIGCISLSIVNSVYAFDPAELASVTKEFKAEQKKIRELKKAGASADVIAAQEAKVKGLREIVVDLQRQQRDSVAELGM